MADGLLTGRVTSRSAAHYTVPRMEGENLEHNLQPTAVLKALAAARRCSPAQLAVAWLLSRGDDIVPVVVKRGELFKIDLQLIQDKI
ncbi:aldo/keto reductase [Salmonella enterica]|uniref:aldo/keto reductase n=1 Tax=Salmonella enterica TaxID=28901 RepID=UPI0034C660D4